MKRYPFLPIAVWLIAAAPAFAAEDFLSAPLASWDVDSMPIVYYVNAEDAADWPEGVGAVIRSFMSWERIPGAQVKVQFAGTTDKKMARDDGENIVTWVKEGWPYGSDTVGYAVLWISEDGQRIVGVDVLLNGEDFVWATEGDPQFVDVQNVLTHEWGHALGLGHSVSSPDLTMFPVILPGETKKRFIGDEERFLMRLVYPTGTTRVLTYSFSETTGRLFARSTLPNYPSAPELGRIYLLTRVDGDGDGLDEIGAIYEKDGQAGFYLFPEMFSETPPAGPLAYDEWSIPLGDNLDLTAVDIDGDGWQEIAALRAESDGSFALYIYDTPLPSDFTEEDAPRLVLRQTLPMSGGNNVLAAMGLDYDRDGVDEVGVVRLTPAGEYFFDIHAIGESDIETDVLASIPLGVNFGFVDLDVLDVDGDGRWELIALWKDRRRWYVSTFQLPDRNDTPEARQVTLLTNTRLVLPSGHTPMRISSLHVETIAGQPRPAICILTSESF